MVEAMVKSTIICVQNLSSSPIFRSPTTKPTITSEEQIVQFISLKNFGTKISSTFSSRISVLQWISRPEKKPIHGGLCSDVVTLQNSTKKMKGMRRRVP
mmetsp:Transcript_6594/g.14302  ORF Transcript_6594/g.14302 Transcript_6594/m.14302 type:complete len:99 (+) Transcript_6594:60-356(+)